MASSNAGKTELSVNVTTSSSSVKPQKDWALLSVRLLAVLATASATIVMAANKQTKNLVVATIGNTPIKVPISAKFHHTPAFVFFVIANGNASLHNLVMIAMDLFGQQFDYKGLRLALIAILDMLVVALASAGDGAATFMAVLGKNGNSHARWDKICDKVEAYCHRSGAALGASLAGIILLLLIAGMSIIKLLKPNRITNVVP